MRLFRGPSTNDMKKLDGPSLIQVGGPQVQVRGTLKCTEKGVKIRKSVTENGSVEQL